MHNITDAELSVITESKVALILDFWADWCAPCKKLGRDLAEVAASYPDVPVLKVNIDDAPRIAARFGVMSVPSLVILHDGDVAGIHGAVSKRRLKEIFEQLS